MSQKPIFVATHPRACSTAFERVFMTRRDTLRCAHEPFGDAYYYGPERLAARYEHDEEARTQSGFSQLTYQNVMEKINKDNAEGKRLLIKDMAQYFIPPGDAQVSIAPSLLDPKRGVGTTDSKVNGDTNVERAARMVTTAPVTDVEEAKNGAKTPYPTPIERENPTVVPAALLDQFHFAFLIRHPKNSVPSYYRCCIPPQDEITAFKGFRNDEAGYVELRRMFDYLRHKGMIGPDMAESPTSTPSVQTNGASGHSSAPICVIDADDLLDKPQEVIETFCKAVGIDFHPEMLIWEDEENHRYAAEIFKKWPGFHDGAIESRSLKPREHKAKSDEQHYSEWIRLYGEEGAQIIQKCVDENVEHYEYLRQFCIKV